MRFIVPVEILVEAENQEAASNYAQIFIKEAVRLSSFPVTEEAFCISEPEEYPEEGAESTNLGRTFGRKFEDESEVSEDPPISDEDLREYEANRDI